MITTAISHHYHCHCVYDYRCYNPDDPCPPRVRLTYRFKDGVLQPPGLSLVPAAPRVEPVILQSAKNWEAFRGY